MKKYKLLTQKGYDFFKKGEIYDENFTHREVYNPISTFVKHYPEDWELVEEEFVLPEKWCVQVGDPDKYEIFKEWRKTTSHSFQYSGSGGYIRNDGIFESTLPKKDFFLLTFEQFKQHVLGMKEQEQQKEIVGWKLKEECKKYESSAVKIVQQEAYDKISKTFAEMNDKRDVCVDFMDNSLSKKLIEQAGVLDLWFEPVYKKEEEFQVGDWVVVDDNCLSEYDKLEYSGVAVKIIEPTKDTPSNCINVDIKYNPEGGLNVYKKEVRKATPEEIKAAQAPQIVVNGYKGEFFDEYVKFGCATISIYLFTSLANIKHHNTNREVESVTIGKGTFSKEQIKQIAEFYLNKNK